MMAKHNFSDSQMKEEEEEIYSSCFLNCFSLDAKSFRKRPKNEFVDGSRLTQTLCFQICLH